MKNEKTNTVTITSNNPSVLDVVNAARKVNLSGAIGLDELQKKLNISRAELVAQCREIDKGDTILVVGRKGRDSKILFGQAGLDFRANRHTNTKVNSPQKVTATGTNVFEFLRLHLSGNQTIDLPIKSTELIVA